jgi:hypothetical protein
MKKLTQKELDRLTELLKRGSRYGQIGVFGCVKDGPSWHEVGTYRTARAIRCNDGVTISADKKGFQSMFRMAKKWMKAALGSGKKQKQTPKQTPK